MPLDPQAATIIELISAVGLGDLTPETDPQHVRDLIARFRVEGALPLARIENRTVPGPAGPIPVRVYARDGDAPKPVLVFFHGGGWVIGDLDSHDATCRALADSVDALVVSVGYRLAPEHRFPAAADDAYAALVWVQAHAAELGGDGERIAVAGDSAGGNLAAVVAQQTRDDDGPRLAFQLLVYPVTDYEFTSPAMIENAEGYFLTQNAMRWFFGHYLERPEQGADPRVSPARATDLSGLAPALVLTAEYDPLRDQGMRYAAALADAGTPCDSILYEGMFHGFFGMGDFIDVAKVAFDDATASLRRALGT